VPVATAQGTGGFRTRQRNGGYSRVLGVEQDVRLFTGGGKGTALVENGVQFSGGKRLRKES